MIVWEMRYFKRVFLNKLWEIHVNILILIIYMISNQKDNFLYENMRNEIENIAVR